MKRSEINAIMAASHEMIRACGFVLPSQPDARAGRKDAGGWYRLPGLNGGPLDPQSSALTC